MFALDGGRDRSRINTTGRAGRFKAPFDAGMARFTWLLDREQPRWFLWLPVFLSIGIGGYFALAVEPTFYIIVAGILLSLGLLFMFRRSMFLVLGMSALFASIIGFTAAKVRTEFVRAPKIIKTSTAIKIHGWVERIEKRGGIGRAKELGKASSKEQSRGRRHGRREGRREGRRITLRLVAAENFRPENLPHRIRLFDKSDQGDFGVGDYVETVAVLRPPPKPALPGGYDFARAAWFKGLGAVGYVVESFRRVEPEIDRSLGLKLWVVVERLRASVGARINAHLNGQAGAVAIALLTGERGQMDQASRDALRHSGLAHILAISGLHMALMSGAVFWCIRALLALSPGLVLTQPIKKWSAVIAIFGACFYLALSGASSATQRAFIMVVLLYVAMLLDRPALSLRNVALAALVILIVWPESLLNIGFQMSFAAVAALISFFEVWNRRLESVERFGRGFRLIDRVGYFLLGIALTTIVAGVAIAPLSAYHFGREAGYSLLANLAALPVFSFITMPMAFISLIAMPFGLEAYPLLIMGWSTDVILGIARWVSELPGAVLYVAQVPKFALLMIAMGALWLMIWQMNWRYLGLIAIAFGLAFFQSGARPDIYISDNGRVIAARNIGTNHNSTGLSSPKGASRSYVLARWLEKDGDWRSASQAARGENYRCDFDGCVTKVKGFLVAHTRNAAGLRDDCARADILITSLIIKRDCKNPKLIIDQTATSEMGAHAIYISKSKLDVARVETLRGLRPWSRH